MTADAAPAPGREPSDGRQFFGADQLALRVEQMVGHPVESLAQTGEIQGLGRGRPRVQVAGDDGVRGSHEPPQRLEDQPLHEVRPEGDENDDVTGHDRQYQGERVFGSEGAGQETRRDAEDQSGRREEGQLDEQYRPQRGFRARTQERRGRPPPFQLCRHAR